MEKERGGTRTNSFVKSLTPPAQYGSQKIIKVADQIDEECDSPKVVLKEKVAFHLVVSDSSSNGSISLSPNHSVKGPVKKIKQLDTVAPED